MTRRDAKKQRKFSGEMERKKNEDTERRGKRQRNKGMKRRDGKK